MKALQACGLEAFDTESVAKSLKTITDNKMNLEKAESEKLGSIQMNFRLQQEEVVEYMEKSFEALKSDMMIPYFN